MMITQVKASIRLSKKQGDLERFGLPVILLNEGFQEHLESRMAVLAARGRKAAPFCGKPPF